VTFFFSSVKGSKRGVKRKAFVTRGPIEKKRRKIDYCLSKVEAKYKEQEQKLAVGDLDACLVANNLPV